MRAKLSSSRNPHWHVQKQLARSEKSRSQYLPSSPRNLRTSSQPPVGSSASCSSRPLLLLLLLSRTLSSLSQILARQTHLSESWNRAALDSFLIRSCRVNTALYRPLAGVNGILILVVAGTSFLVLAGMIPTLVRLSVVFLSICCAFAQLWVSLTVAGLTRLHVRASKCLNVLLS